MKSQPHSPNQTSKPLALLYVPCRGPARSPANPDQHLNFTTNNLRLEHKAIRTAHKQKRLLVTAGVDYFFWQAKLAHSFGNFV
ncbi:MAG: hypothetical protein ACRCRW_15250 [Aeromonadaceae bacterium]